jgi:hypothetical protein
MPVQPIGSLLFALVLATQFPVADVPGSDPSFAECVASAGDLDGDGKNDWLVADTTPGWVWAISGATSKPLYRLEGKSPIGAGFTNIASLGDVNGDRRPDILVSTGRHSSMPVRVYSGSDGKLLYEVAAEWAALVGDVNGDGIADFVTSTVMPSGGGPDGENIRLDICSGSTGVTIREMERIEKVGWTQQMRPFGVGDINADGTPDWAVVFRDKAVVFSGKSMAEFLSFGSRESIAPRSICNAGDMDGDGSVDLFVGYPVESDDSTRGAVVLYSVRTDM